MGSWGPLVQVAGWSRVAGAGPGCHLPRGGATGIYLVEGWPIKLWSICSWETQLDQGGWQQGACRLQVLGPVVLMGHWLGWPVKDCFNSTDQIFSTLIGQPVAGVGQGWLSGLAKVIMSLDRAARSNPLNFVHREAGIWLIGLNSLFDRVSGPSSRSGADMCLAMA